MADPLRSLRSVDNLINKLGKESGSIRAFHGSPRPTHFDKFDGRYIGSGEGAQVYSHGHYLAQLQDVADNYRRNLSGRKLRDDFGRIGLADDADAEEVMESLPLFDERQQRFLKALHDDDWLGFEYPSQAISQSLKQYRGQSGLNGYEHSDALLDARNSLGTGYEVELPFSEDALLDWDAPFGQQPEAVRRLVGSGRYFGMVGEPGDGRRMWWNLKDSLTARGAADNLSQHGIPGVRYLDGGSRAAEPSTGVGTRNYVIFPGAEDQIRILRKYGLLAPVATGAAMEQE